MMRLEFMLILLLAIRGKIDDECSVCISRQTTRSASTALKTNYVLLREQPVVMINCRSQYHVETSVDMCGCA